VTARSVSHKTKKHIITKDVVSLLLGEVVSTKKKHIIVKDVFGLLIGEVVSMKKTHIVAEDVVGLQVGDSKNDSLTKMKTY
jgi:general stress protein CsbA